MNSEKQRSVSIAWKITWSFVGKMLAILVCMDILVAAAILGIFFYVQESAVLGGDWQLQMQRSIVEWTYYFGDYSIDLLPYKQPVMVLLRSVGIIQTVMVVAEIPHSVKRARKYLRPLDEMAAAAQRLAQVEEAYLHQDLKMREAEDAISHCVPNKPDERLFTGNRDLAGIENAVNELLEKVHQSYQQQIRFVSDASHELRTPISVIQGYANMLGRWGKEDEAILDESIHAIQTESEHMKKLVEQLLFLARGDSGRNPLMLEELQLDALVQEVYEESSMIDPDHNWQMKVQPGVKAWGDSAMLKQAFRILVDNARKYTPSGESVELRAYYNEVNLPCLEVQDHGIGMRQEDADHIFERFYRADEARKKGGSGLGLSIAKWIVDRHGGHFEVLSREDLGTRITMVLQSKEES